MSEGAEAAVRTRRAVLGAAVGGAAAMAAVALGRPSPALAADGDPVLLGESNTAEHGTVITRQPGLDDTVAIVGVNAAGVGVLGESVTGEGLIGRSESGAGVQGYSDTDAGVNGFGVYGVWASGQAQGIHGEGPGVGTLGYSIDHSTGVIGASGDGSGMPGGRPKVGVLGHAAQDAGARGVLGVTTVGQGVRGEATSGTGGAFRSATGYALSTSGRVRFARVSGIATIVAGTAGKTVSPGVNLVAATFVLLTPRGNLRGRDLWYTVDTVTNQFRIRVSSPVGANVSIGWLVVG